MTYRSTHHLTEQTTWTGCGACLVVDKKVPPFLFLREKLIQSSKDSVRFQNYRYRRQSITQYTGNGRFEGYIMQLLERIRSVIRGIDFEYEVELVPDGELGAPGDYDRIWNGMIGEVVRGKADVAAGPLTVTASRKTAVDFTDPFMSTGIQALTLHPNWVKPYPFRVVFPFTIDVWFLSLIVFAIVSLMLFLFNLYDPYEWKATADKGMSFEENGANFNLKNSLWFCASTLFFQSSDSTPRSNAGRCIAGFWWFYVVCIVFLYITNLGYFVSSNRRLAFIQDPSDLRRETQIKYGAVFGGNSYHVFKTTPSLQDFWHKMNNEHTDVYVASIQEGVERVRRSNGHYALLADSPEIRYISSQKPCDMRVAGAYIYRGQYAFAVAKDSPLAEHLSSAIEALRDNGVLEDLVRDWWDLEDRRDRCHNLTKFERSGAYSMHVNDLSGVYYILMIGILFAIITFALEYAYYMFKGGPPPKGQRGGAAITGYQGSGNVGSGTGGYGGGYASGGDSKKDSKMWI